MKKYLLSVFVLAGVVGFGFSADAATCTYIGPAGGDWHTAANWDCEGSPAVPGGDDLAVLPPAAMVSGTSATIAPGALTVSAGAVLDAVNRNIVVSPGTTTNQGTIQSTWSLSFRDVENQATGIIRSAGIGSIDFNGAVINTGSIETDLDGLTALFRSSWDNTGGSFDSGFLLRFEGSQAQTVPSNVTSVYGLQMQKTGDSTLTLQADLETTDGSVGLGLSGAGPATLDLGGFTITVRANASTITSGNTVQNGEIVLVPTFGSATFFHDGVMGNFDADLTIDAAGTITFDSSAPGGIFEVGGDLTVLSGTIEVPSGDQFYVDGTTTNAGTINNNALSTLFTGSVTNTGTIGSSGSGSVDFMGHADNQGTFTFGSAYVSFWSTWDNSAGTINPEARVEIFGSNDMTLPAGITVAWLNIGKFADAARVTLSGDVTVNGTTLLQGGVLDLDGHTLFTRNLSGNSGGFDPNLGTVEIIGSGSSERINDVDSFYRLRINPTGATDVIHLRGNPTIQNTLEVVNGILRLSSSGSNSLTFTGAGTGGARPFVAAPDAFQANGGTVRYVTAGGPTDIEALAYADLEIDGSGNTFDAYASTTVTGALNVSAGTTLRLLDRLEAVGPIDNQGLISVVVGPFIHPADSLLITNETGTEVSTVNAGANTLFVTLQDGNRNLDGTVAETVTVTVSTDAAAGGDSETLTLTETGPATGIFRNATGQSLVHIIGAVTPGNGRFELTAGGTLTASYVDATDGSDVASDSATVSTVAVSAPAPVSSGGGGGGGSLAPIVPTYQEYTYGAGSGGLPVGATGTAMEAHSLVKLPDDGNPNTQADSAVYYIGTDGMRHAFPNDKVYFTWYASFDGIQIVSQEQLASIPLGKNVTYKPGVKLVKFTTDPKVYAVAPRANLRWVTTEAIAVSLYGADWAKMVDDISDAFYTNYMFGAEITEASQYDVTEMRAAAQYPSSGFTAEEVL